MSQLKLKYAKKMDHENRVLSSRTISGELAFGTIHEITIIGAGPNGIFLASELIKAGKKVLLLEAGSFYGKEGLLTRNSYIFKAPSKMPTQIHTVGGGSTKWLGRVGQFIATDFLPKSGRPECWPLKYDELQNHFRKVFELIISSGHLDQEFINQNEILRKISSDLPKTLQMRIFRFCDLEFFSNMIMDLLENPNFTLVTNSTCQEIIPYNEQYYVLKILNSESKETIAKINTRKIIVAGGTLQSTALIMRSKNLNIPSKEKFLGKNLMEHFDGFVGSIVVKRKNNQVLKQFLLASDRSFNGENFGIAFSFSDKEIHSNVTPNFHFEVTKFKKRFVFERPLRFLSLPHFIQFFFLFLERAIRKVGDPILRIYDSLLRQKRYTVWMKGEEYPYEDSKIDLVNMNEAALPKILYQHKISQKTSECIRAGLINIGHVIEEENLGKFKVYKYLLNKKISFYLNPNWHPMGTMRMAESRHEGICDSNLEVFGCPGLFLLNAAVFPTGSNQNPTCMVMALGHRLGEHLLKHSD